MSPWLFQPPLLLFLFAADSSLTQRAINAAGWAEQAPAGYTHGSSTAAA
ncbi:hypothetical protein HaLaN_26636 [Haematococcus lacustris]|uniref:Uncharacterized protein n=1 Tax=Haematococcus lacustris TaxID=44745 RepID=A0A6A0A6K5_HAELA|nr:hypothetical protein HaLaN_26636 [Haematococcus lacustris]